MTELLNNVVNQTRAALADNHRVDDGEEWMGILNAIKAEPIVAKRSDLLAEVVQTVFSDPRGSFDETTWKKLNGLIASGQQQGHIPAGHSLFNNIRLVRARQKFLETTDPNIVVKVRDVWGNILQKAAARVYDSDGRFTDLKFDGDHFAATLEPGAYTLIMATPESSITASKELEIKPGMGSNIDAMLRSYKNVANLQFSRFAQITFEKKKIEFKKSGDGEKLTDESCDMLDQLVDFLNLNPQIKKIQVDAHTDNANADKAQAKLALSRKRAHAVAAYLVNHGVDLDRVSWDGYGQTRPLVPNLTPANRAKNHRIEFRIVTEDFKMPPFIVPEKPGDQDDAYSSLENWKKRADDEAQRRSPPE